MATGFAIIKRLAEKGLQDYAFLDARLRQLRNAGLAPAGQQAPGRAGPQQSVVHWPAHPYVPLITSLTAPTHATAPDAARMLSSMPNSGVVAGDDGRYGGPLSHFPGHDLTFGQFLEASILRISKMDAVTLAAEKEDKYGATLTMTLDPPWAEVRLPSGEVGEAIKLIFEYPSPPRQAGWNALYDPRYAPKGELWCRRTIVIPYAIVITCGELLATNPASDTFTGGPSSGINPTPSTPNENAPDPARSEASTREGQRQPATGSPPSPGTSNTPEIREDGKPHQVPSGLSHRLPRAQFSEELRQNAHQAA